ncbi:site-2 protease family protein [Tautonia plasticadhaerens]|uniref:Regulator of sigma-E protease RseP n=1 Tax=Tautonia plasticadhaerens TaxID=2527974 RepID=A0A518H5M3_9BACT|nr:site-2 protease family protein [Tautonia plasticadhaerens]QDV36143.1 Regulator of sigma-E protease RseP [Tautonia plasticadhaerens]
MGTLITVWTIIKAVLGISFVIFWHELGHFLLAKWNGVYVKTFSIGFPPRLVRLFKHRETEYVLGSVPLGGYVHMLGEDEGQTEPAPGSPGVTDAEGQPRADVEPSLANHPGAFFNKSVWARMAIISAGVVMNIILGVLCFAVVYMAGGRLEAPAILGGVAAGGPAYRAGLQAGDVVLAIDGEENVTFEDLNRIVVHSGPEQVLTFTVDRPGVAEPFDVPVRPERDPIEQVPKIRVALPRSLELIESDPFTRPPGMDGEPEGEFEAGDHIIRVGPAGEEPTPIDSPVALDRLLDEYRDAPLTFVVSRDPPETGSNAEENDGSPEAGGANVIERARITVPPSHFVDFGFRLNPGPVVALREGSPAAEAGLEVGDLIVAVDGNPDYDPMRLPEQAADRVGSTLMLTVVREGEEVSLTVTPVEGESWSRAISPDSPLNVDAIGLAMRVEPEVVAVREGSPAAEAGLKPGDSIAGLRFSWPKDEGEEEARVEDLTFGEAASWVYAFDFAQNFRAESIELRVEGREAPVAISPEVAADWYYPDRGVRLQLDVVPIPPMAVADALNRAGTETLEVIGSFYTLLQRLVEGQVGTKGLSGPIRIAKAFYDFAGVNFVEFLWFLGFISINLAVVNFLPIPPLDGGRMVFLIGEAVRGRPLPESWQALPTYLGLFFLLGLMAFVLIQDTIVTFF